MKLYQSLLATFIFATLSVSVGCASTSDAVDDGKAMSGIVVTPDKDTLTTGTTFQFVATAQYADGTTKDVSSDRDTLWNTSDPTLATISDTGLVTALAVGVVAISATYNTEKDEETFAVTP